VQAAQPNGGRAALRAAARRELGLAEAARVVGGVGLLNDAKGFDVLVAAAPLLPPDVQLLVVGHGERDDELRRQAESLGVGARVHFTGWRDDLPRLHAAMDVFALPSRWEGLPYALLEALASGLPCVSTDVNGSRDVLAGDPPCGLLVPREDPPALAAALTRLLDDAPLRQRLSALGPQRVRSAFTVDGMVDGLLALYRELLGRAA
jgi:glycosyltransferase involved in cell wall biosynthesis